MAAIATAAAIGHLIRGTPGRAVQITSWTTDMGVSAEAVLQTGATTATVHPTARPTAHPVAHPTALLAVPLIVPLIAIGPPTALGSSPPTDAGPNPQTPTAGIAPQRDRPAAPRSLLWMSLY